MAHNKKLGAGQVALRIVAGLLLALVLLFAAVYLYYHSKIGLLQFDDGTSTGAGVDTDLSDEEETLSQAADMEAQTDGLEERDAVEATSEILKDPNVINILLLGTDERTTQFSDNARGDSCMLLSINKKGSTPVISLVSFERGMGVPILDGQYEGQWDWLTHTFRYGGAELQMREIRECFKLDVDYYVRVNFATFIEGINALGGVDISLTEAEARYFVDGCKLATAVAGVNHLDGEMALSYARLREIDSDWNRIQRQRTVVQAAINQTKNLSVAELDSLLNTVLPLIRTNLTEAKITELLLLAPSLRGAQAQQLTIPVSGTYGSMKGMGGRSMFSVDFETNAQILREFLYGES